MVLKHIHMDHKIQARLDELKVFITAHALNSKPFLTLTEAAEFIGVSTSYLYKKTAAREIPFHRPDDAKLIYFDRTELTSWVLSNRQDTKLEVNEKGIESFTHKTRKNGNK